MSEFLILHFLCFLFWFLFLFLFLVFGCFWFSIFFIFFGFRVINITEHQMLVVELTLVFGFYQCLLVNSILAFWFVNQILSNPHVIFETFGVLGWNHSTSRFFHSLFIWGVAEIFSTTGTMFCLDILNRTPWYRCYTPMSLWFGFNFVFGGKISKFLVIFCSCSLIIVTYSSMISIEPTCFLGS